MSYYTFVNGVLDFIVNPSLTPWFPLLNTSDWKVFIPQLSKQYPDMSLQFEFFALDYPTFQFVSTQGGAAATALFAKNMSVINGSSLAFTDQLILDASGSLAITAGMKGGNATLFATMTSMALNLSVGISELGPLDPVLLELITAALGPALMKAVNVVGAMGFPLPTLDGLSILNPHVLYNDGYVTVSSDFNYVPPPPKHDEEPEEFWECNDDELTAAMTVSHLCTRVHRTILTDPVEKTLYWAEAQDVVTGVVVRGFDSDTPANAVSFAISALLGTSL